MGVGYGFYFLGVFEVPGLFEHGPLSSMVIESLIFLWTVNHNITYRCVWL